MSLLYALESIRTPFLNEVFLLFTRFGEETIVVVVFCALYWCIDKSLAYCVGVGYFFSSLLVQMLKISFRIERPWVLDPNFKPVEGALAQATGYSFPSGHTNSATALYGSLAMRAGRKWQRAVCIALIVLVGFSRMYLGVHTPLDVVVALLLTLLVCAAAYAFDRHYGAARFYDAAVAAAMLLIAAAAFLLSLCIYHSGLITIDNVADCFKAAGAALGFAAGYYIERRWIRFSVKCDRLWKQAVKFALGIGGLLACKQGLKPLLGTAPVASAVRYFIVILWATVLFPLIIRRFFAAKDNDVA